MAKRIPLSQGYRRKKRNEGLFAIVDDEDYDWLNQWRWCAIHTGRRSGGYAMRMARDESTGKQKSILMHRLILNAPEDMLVDHVNGDSLDNRRSNLRLATFKQDRANRRLFKNSKSGFKGVHFDKDLGRWKLTVSAHFDTAEEAAHMYDRIVRMLHGEFAKTNFNVES